MQRPGYIPGSSRADCQVSGGIGRDWDRDLLCGGPAKGMPGFWLRNSPYIQAGGGIGIDVGIYYTTAMVNILGEVKEVCGMSGVCMPEQSHYFVKNENFGETYVQESETYLAGSLQFKNGCVGTLHFNSRSIRTEKPYVAFYGTEESCSWRTPTSLGVM